MNATKLIGGAALTAMLLAAPAFAQTTTTATTTTTTPSTPNTGAGGDATANTVALMTSALLAVGAAVYTIRKTRSL